MRIIKVETTLKAVDPSLILPLELHIDPRGQIIAYYKEMGDIDFDDLQDFAITYGLDDRQVEYLTKVGFDDRPTECLRRAA